MRPFHLEIATPDGLLFDGMAESLLIKTDDGDVEILCGHADLLASVATGRARIISNGKTRYASASGGFLSVQNGKVKVVAITFEYAEEIDVNRAKKAKENAEHAISVAINDRDMRVAKAKLARAISRINIATK